MDANDPEPLGLCVRTPPQWSKGWKVEREDQKLRLWCLAVPGVGFWGSKSFMWSEYILRGPSVFAPLVGAALAGYFLNRWFAWLTCRPGGRYQCGRFYSLTCRHLGHRTTWVFAPATDFLCITCTLGPNPCDFQPCISRLRMMSTSNSYGRFD